MKISVKSILCAAKAAFFAGVVAAFSGCGAPSPKAPEEAVAGVYVNLEKGIGDLKDAVKVVSAKLQLDVRISLNSMIKTFEKTLETKLGSKNAMQWAFVTVHCNDLSFDKGKKPGVGLAVCVKDGEKAISALKEIAKMKKTDSTIAGQDVYLFYNSKVLRCKNILLASYDEKVLKALIRVYDGSDNRNKNFDSIAYLEGNCYARILVPRVGDLIKRSVWATKVDEFAKVSRDSKLKDSIYGLGDVTFDVGANGDDVSAKLSVTAANRKDAEFIENIFEVAAYSRRFCLDAIAVDQSIIAVDKSIDAKTLDALHDIYDGAYEADCNGRTATLSFSAKTEKIADVFLGFADTCIISGPLLSNIRKAMQSARKRAAQDAIIKAGSHRPPQQGQTPQSRAMKGSRNP